MYFLGEVLEGLLALERVGFEEGVYLGALLLERVGVYFLGLVLFLGVAPALGFTVLPLTFPGEVLFRMVRSEPVLRVSPETVGVTFEPGSDTRTLPDSTPLVLRPDCPRTVISAGFTSLV